MEGLSESDGGFLAEITGAIPGIDEAMSFAEVMKLIQSLEYDTVVFDTAPTGHTLRLLQFPDTLQRALGKLQQLQGTIGPMISAMGPMLGGGTDTGGLFSQLSELQVLSCCVAMHWQHFSSCVVLRPQPHCGIMLLVMSPQLLLKLVCREEQCHSPSQG